MTTNFLTKKMVYVFTRSYLHLQVYKLPKSYCTQFCQFVDYAFETIYCYFILKSQGHVMFCMTKSMQLIMQKDASTLISKRTCIFRYLMHVQRPIIIFIISINRIVFNINYVITLLLSWLFSLRIVLFVC